MVDSGVKVATVEVEPLDNMATLPVSRVHGGNDSDEKNSTNKEMSLKFVRPKPDKRTSLFIVMSFVYAKLLIVICIAYVISDAVTHNIPTYYYEGFFTYLYGMSIFFLLYVFCFLLQESSCCSGAEKGVKPPSKHKKKEKDKPKEKDKGKVKVKDKEKEKKEEEKKKEEERQTKEKKQKDKDKKNKKQEKQEEAEEPIPLQWQFEAVREKRKYECRESFIKYATNIAKSSRKVYAIQQQQFYQTDTHNLYNCDRYINHQQSSTVHYFLSTAITPDIFNDKEGATRMSMRFFQKLTLPPSSFDDI
ncbi:hypothetical protein JTB14_007319 [Gonioctena quinquepunctata]|nr:hypothetical protein JTB14_007319 [Gonioctena quinquepunctata]